MAKNRMHTVSTKKKSGNHCGTITVEDQLRMSRAGRRAAAIAAGHNQASGSGAHGGNKRQKNRRDRRQGKVAVRDTNW